MHLQETQYHGIAFFYAMRGAGRLCLRCFYNKSFFKTTAFYTPIKQVCYFAVQISYMIQRIQSLWLLLAAASFFFVFKFPIAGGKTQSGAISEQFAASNLLMFIIAILLGIVALVAIFFFKNRSSQKSLIWLGILLDLVFIVMMYFQMENLKSNPALINQTFKMGAIFPILYIILLVMAYSGIRKDEKLIKSVDRLR